MAKLPNTIITPNQSHVIRMALHSHMDEWRAYRNTLVDYLIANGSERFLEKADRCQEYPLMLPHERDNILKEIRGINTHMQLLHNYDAHLMLRVESGAMITSFDEWMKENRQPDPESKLKEHLDNIKAGRCCLFDNVTCDEESRRYLDRVLRQIDPDANFKLIRTTDRFFYYDKQKSAWIGDRDTANAKPYIKLSEVMHLR